MNETTKNSIISVFSSLILLAAGIPAFASFLTPDLVAKLQSGIPTIVGALSAIIMAGTLIYKAFPKSQASIAKGAIEQSSIKKIEVTPALAMQVNHPDVVAK